MYQSILKLFGKPRYYSKDKDFFNGVWEKGNTIFLLKQNYTTKIGGEKTVTTDLFILNKKIDFLVNYYYGFGFKYYKDYLEAKIKKQDSSYTYQQFAEDMKNDWDYSNDKYLKELENNLPL